MPKDKKYQALIEENEILKQEINTLLEKNGKMITLGEMMSNIAHQWKQPLSVINIELSGMQYNAEFQNLETKDFILPIAKRIEEQVMYLSDTIDSFNYFSKEDTKKRIISVYNELERTVHISENVLKDLYIEFYYDIKASMSFKIEAFKGHLMQAVMNLLSNAKDALIINKIEEPKVYLTTENDEDILIIKVQDNGGGIPEEIKDKIFERNFSTKKEDGGTGLGLDMVKKIIEEKMGGEVSVENVSGGSLFTIKIKKYKNEEESV